MRSEWFATTIGEQATLQRGIDITKAEQRPGRVPVISSGGISSYHDTATVRGPGVVLGRKGVVGSVYYIQEDFWPHDTSLWVKDFHGNDPRFVYYFFKSITPQLAALDVGSANPTLNRNHVHPLPTVWPTLSLQKDIVSTLSMLDDRIDLLRQTNATLESIAQALFKSWFIDFDPVRAKQAGREPEGMDAATAALFPAEFEESALGLIPKGWKAESVSAIASLRGGKQLDRSEFDVEAPNPIFGGAGEMGRTRLSNTDGFVLTVGRVGAYCGQFFWYCGPAWVNNNASLVKPHLPTDAYWTHQALLASDMNRIKKGAAQPFVSNSDIEALPLALPDIAVRVVFHDHVEPLYRRQSVNLTHLRALEELRDTLLPRLISGKLHLPEAQERLEDALA